jgi:hypothetical protein
MARTTRSDSDAALIKRRASSEKTKRRQPFVLESFPSHADRGMTKAKYRKNETIFRQGDSPDAVFYIMDADTAKRMAAAAKAAAPPSNKRYDPDVIGTTF